MDRYAPIPIRRQRIDALFAEPASRGRELQGFVVVFELHGLPRRFVEGARSAFLVLVNVSQRTLLAGIYIVNVHLKLYLDNNCPEKLLGCSRYLIRHKSQGINKTGTAFLVQLG